MVAAPTESIPRTVWANLEPQRPPCGEGSYREACCGNHRSLLRTRSALPRNVCSNTTHLSHPLLPDQVDRPSHSPRQNKKRGSEWVGADSERALSCWPVIRPQRQMGVLSEFADRVWPVVVWASSSLSTKPGTTVKASVTNPAIFNRTLRLKRIWPARGLAIL